MFGYVKTSTPDLRVKENEFYRALYCGLCRSMGHKSPFLSLSLSYDFVFLALVRMAISGEKVEIGKKRCIVHPVKKRPYVKRTPTLDYCADVSALLLYYNLRDDLADKRGFRRLLSAICLPKVKSMRKKAVGDGSLDRYMEERLAEIAAFEQEQAPGIYTCAEPFGQLLGEVFAHGIEDPATARCLFEFGRRIGRWIYLVDALDDLEDDRKSGNYNPFLTDGGAEDEHFRENARDTLTFELIEAEKAVGLLYFRNSGMFSVIQNILYLGLPAVAEKILFPADGETDNQVSNSTESGKESQQL